MAVNSKHVATFLLGLAAGVAANKYMNMSDDEKAKMADNLKSNADDFRTEAEGLMEKGKEYFEELKEKGTTIAQKEMGSSIEDILETLFGKKGDDGKTTG